MSRWKLTFEYDGTEFCGWQKQPKERTVEDEIEKAFSELFQEPIDLVGQGRTDSGVHARGQTAHADLPDTFSSQKILHAMKGMLPGDIVLLQAEKEDDSFHARFDATSRTYSYRVTGRPTALDRNRTWYCGYPLKKDILQNMAEAICGTHDFVNFCIPGPDDKMTTLSTITESYWETGDEMMRYVITGNRFLRHMVRRLVGTMIQVAAGKRGQSQFNAMIDGVPADDKGHSAPPHGLYLESVAYDPISLNNKNV